MSNLIITYERDISMIDFMLKIRAASPAEKLSIYGSVKSEVLQAVNQRYWAYSEKELLEIKSLLSDSMEKFLNGVDISSITT